MDTSFVESPTSFRDLLWGPPVLDFTHDAVCVRSLDGGQIAYWNLAAEMLYGWTRGEAVGRRSHALFDTVFPAPLDRIEAELMYSGCWEGELVHSRKDGSRVTVASRWSLLYDASWRPIAVLEAHSDVTGRRCAETERARLEERLRQAEKMEAIGRFASGIAHDFNNVLHGILAYGEMLLEDAPDAKRRRYAQNVLTAAGRGHELAEQILGYIRNLRRKPEPTDVCGTVAETLELLRGSAPAEVTLASSVPDTAIVVMGSDTQLHQVVMNLCTNSLQAMGAKGTVRVAIEPMDLREERALSHGSALPGPWVCVRVEDDGCGMDEVTLERIFEPGFTTKASGRGTGLGLSLVRAIVADLGGAIDVRSVPGEGSAFSIYLPTADGRQLSPTTTQAH